jgi:transposase
VTVQALRSKPKTLDWRSDDQSRADALSSWRLRVVQHASTGARNVARTCRHFGISRKTFYKWKQRYDEHGAAGLADRPRTPHGSPKATPREVVSKILYLREQYHLGPGRIADYLKRFLSSRSPGRPSTASLVAMG